MKKILIVCTTDSMIYNFLMPHIEYLKKNGYSIDCVCSRTGFYFDFVRDHCNVNIYEMPFTRNPISFSNIKSIKKTNNIIKKEKYDIVFCHEPVGGVVGRLCGYKNKCKVVYMAHGFHFYKGAPAKNKIIYYSVEKFLSRFTDILITINDEDYESSKKFKAKKNIKLNGIGIDTKKFINKKSNFIREKYKLKSDDIVLLSVGELIDRKNHISIIKAIEKIKNSELYYFIVGDGANEKLYKQYIKDHKLTNNIHLLGYCKNVNELCNSSDVFIMPSLQEGLSVALMEAMACGKKIIASKIRGNVDLIDDNYGGILVNPRDIDGYVSAIKRITNDNNCNSFGFYNIKKIKNFDIEIIKKDILKIMKEEL